MASHDPAVTDAMRHRLRSKVAHASEILHDQGPISTFIHTNPLHGLEHLPFEQAIREARRLTGGRGYLPNEEYRRLHHAGRITDEDLDAALGTDREPAEREAVTTLYERRITDRDIRRLHLLHGVEPLDPSTLPWHVFHGRATGRFRDDVPEEARRRVLLQSATEFRLGLDRVGHEWTLAQWVGAQTNLDLIGHLRDDLCHRIQFGEINDHRLARANGQARIDRLLDELEIPSERRSGYLRCIQHQLFNIGVYAAERLQELCIPWLEAERRLLHRLAPTLLGCRGTFAAIQRRGTGQPEACAVRALWYAALASRGLDDPLSGINGVSLLPESAEDRQARRFARVTAALTAEGGLPIPLTADLSDAIESEVNWLGRRHGRRRAILAALGQGLGAGSAAEDPPLTFRQAPRDLLAALQRRATLSSPALRLLMDLERRGGCSWALWDEVQRRPLVVGLRRVDDGRWRATLREGLRVRLSDEVRALVREEYAPRRTDQTEARRTTLLEGLTDEGLTLAAWEALQADLADWRRASEDGTAVEEERLCRAVLAGLHPTELARPAYAALEVLVALRGKTGPRARLLSGLRRLDPHHQLVLAARKALADEMASLGHDLTLSDFLRRMTGLDLTAHVNQYMIRWCAAFLDQGLAAWPMPGRERGFYAAWKRLAETDASFRFLGVEGWREALRALPDRPDDALMASLQALGIAEEHWSEYLARRLAQLPGWAGLIKWREQQRPQDPRQQEQPIDLLQYLAVRLFCEATLIRSVCRRTWGIEGTARDLHHYFKERPGEFLVRHEQAAGGLPEDLRRRAATLVDQRPGRVDERAWFRLAVEIWAYRQDVGPGHNTIHTVCRNAWRLFHLAQLLGLTAGELRALSVIDTDRWLEVLDGFPSDEHGPVWLRAYERPYQQRLLAGLRGHDRATLPPDQRPRAQFVLCIDEREESFRRHIEAQDPAYETFGTAGFFGVAMWYAGLGRRQATPLCPVVVTPVHRVSEVAAPDQGGQTDRYARRSGWLGLLHRLFSTLKANVVTAYFLIDVTGFLLGLLLAGKTVLPRRLARILEGLRRAVAPPPTTRLQLDAEPTADEHRSEGPREGFAVEEQAGIVEGQLRMMGLTRGFARLVLVFGHGSASQNNPHESAYDCGACGGKHGGPNARALAAMANKPEVRFALRQRGIDIPVDCFFIGALHNTASDAMSYFETERIPFTHRYEFERVVRDLDVARALNAKERCRLLPRAPKRATPARSLRHVERRAVDFAQVNPEWGHATNASVLVGRRVLTKGLFLDRRAFLQSYDPTQDPDGAILERILTAVVPVAAGIGLEYYFSSVDNRRYGCGTKVPHNVTGLVGVMDGAQSDLRTGLPRQMVWLHEPMRLIFVVEANPRIINAIVQRHRALQKLFDHRWAHLVVLDFRSGGFLRYEPKGHWRPMPEREPAPLPQGALSGR